MIDGYKRLFLNKKTFMAAFAVAVALLPVSVGLRAFAGGLTIFNSVNAVLCLLLVIGLRLSYDRENLIRMNGLVSGILMLELSRYAYLAEQILKVGNEEIVALGFFSCMTLSGYLMICFILILLTLNHFSIDLHRPGGKSRIIVNQLSILFLLVCFAGVTVTGLQMDGNLPKRLTDAVSFLADLALFVDVACCELTIAIDSMLL